MWFEVGRNDAADASSSVGYILSLLVIFQDVGDLGAYIGKRCILRLLKGVLQKVGTIFRLEKTVDVCEACTLDLSLIRSFKVSGRPLGTNPLFILSQVSVLVRIRIYHMSLFLILT